MMGAVPGPELVEVEPARWDALVRDLGVSDVYYARGLVEASAPLAGGAPALLHLTGADGDVLFPCVVRRDPVDVVTPYGYGGPLGVGARPPLEEFAAAYQAWCERRGAVSSFVVFHPLFANDASEVAAGFHRNALAGTVAWPLEGRDIFAAMHKHHRRVVRRARAEGYEVAIDPQPAGLGGFVDVYEQTMRRTEAAPFYFFPDSYWQALVRDVPLVVVEVRQGGELLASVLGMGEPPWLHYHLGGTADAGRTTGASHLALFRLAVWGQEHGYRALHLGGGVGGRDDSLLEFKLRFAPDGLVGASVGKAVHDEAAYLRLSGADAVDWDAFFPAYRAPR
jgi:serine/alanine adding enzyme